MDRLVKLHGPNGSYIYVKEVNGRYYQAHPVIHGNIEDVHSDMKARPDDVIICSFPKSGLHWVWEIVTMLQRGNSSIVTHLPEGSILDMRPPASIDHLPSPRVLATHCRPEQLPESVRENGTQLICLFRDPRAVAVSAYHHFSNLSGTAGVNMPWKDFVYFFNNGLAPWNSWFTYVKSWHNFIKENKKQHRIHVMQYEDLKADPVGEIQRLSEALRHSYDMNLIKSIASATCFERLKAKKDPIASKKNMMFATGKYEIYRKGEVDDWKNYYTVKQNDEVTSLFHAKLKGTDLKLKSSL